MRPEPYGEPDHPIHSECKGLGAVKIIICSWHLTEVLLMLAIFSSNKYHIESHEIAVFIGQNCFV